MTYLTDLVRAMITIDAKRTFPDEIALSDLSQENTCIGCRHYKSYCYAGQNNMDAYLVSAEQVDDPWLLLLEKVYKGQVYFVHDIAARQKLFRVARISYWVSTKYEVRIC
jgi:hypothetical protein